MTAVFDAVDGGAINVVQMLGVAECDMVAYGLKRDWEIATLLLLRIEPLDVLLEVNRHDLLRHAREAKVPVLLRQLEDEDSLSSLHCEVDIGDLRFEHRP